MTSFDEMVRVQERHESQLMSLPGVVGVGIGECDQEPCLKVFVTEKTSELEDQISDKLDGITVDIEAIGPVQALPESGPAAASFDELVRVQEQHESQLMSLPSVVGIGIGECDRLPCFKVFVAEKTPELESQIPQELDGIKVDIVETGPINTIP